MSKENFLLPNGEIYRVKNDGYRRNRGGNSEILDISCTGCDSRVLIYQKDGPGHLKRCYLDRIVYQPESDNLDDETLLKCPGCNQLIGTRMIYKPENREAYGLVPGSFSKKKYQQEK